MSEILNQSDDNIILTIARLMPPFVDTNLYCNTSNYKSNISD